MGISQFVLRNKTSFFIRSIFQLQVLTELCKPRVVGLCGFSHYVLGFDLWLGSVKPDLLGKQFLGDDSISSWESKAKKHLQVATLGIRQSGCSFGLSKGHRACREKFVNLSSPEKKHQGETKLSWEGRAAGRAAAIFRWSQLRIFQWLPIVIVKGMRAKKEVRTQQSTAWDAPPTLDHNKMKKS